MLLPFFYYSIQLFIFIPVLLCYFSNFGIFQLVVKAFFKFKFLFNYISVTKIFFLVNNDTCLSKSFFKHNS